MRVGLGGVQLTPFGVGVLLVVLLVGFRPPAAIDPQLAGLVWVALLGVLLAGALWPLMAVRFVRATARSPEDASVGDDVPLDIELTGRIGRCEVRVLDPIGPWHRAAAPGGGRLPHRAATRGVFDVVRLEVRTTAPVGVVAVHRVLTVALPRAVSIAPRPLQVQWREQPAPVDGERRRWSATRLGGDTVRAVRPYAVGDPAHLVHWPSSARIGSLVVRELEPPAPTGQAVVVDLRGPPADAERAASYAAGAVRAVLAAGGQVMLSTCERGGPVTAPVTSTLQAGRRLARAVAGPPGAPPPGWPIVELGA